MIIQKLNIENFRNIEKLTLSLNEGVNIIVGKNAQGKTNILENIVFFSLGKSFRGTKEKELVKFKETFSKSELFFLKDERAQHLKIMLFTDKKKKMSFNGIELLKTKELLQNFQTVLFTPDDLDLIKEGPQGRRKFLDLCLCQIDLKYFINLLHYTKILLQRNCLLKEIVYNQTLEKTLDIWDENLSIYGTLIIQKRADFIKKLNQKALYLHSEISEQKEKLSLTYQNSLYDKEKIAEKMKDALFLNRKEDIKTGQTSIGPHRDDMEICINEKKAKAFASQGQIRSSVLSLKLSQAQLIKEETGYYPVILLDDILSELDPARQSFVLDKTFARQCIVTTCETEKIKEKYRNTVFIENGKIN